MAYIKNECNQEKIEFITEAISAVTLSSVSIGSREDSRHSEVENRTNRSVGTRRTGH